MTEGEIHAAFIAYLNKVGVPFRHDRMDKRTTTKVGEPDFAIYSNGRVLFVEVKRLGGKLRPEQQKRKQQLEAAGCRVCLCFSVEECVHAVMVWLGTTKRDSGHPGARKGHCVT